MFEFIKAADLKFVTVNGPRERFVLTIDNKETFGHLDEKIIRHLNRLSKEEQIAVAEIVDGGVDNHNIYASKNDNTEAVFEDMENIPYIYGSPKHLDVIMNAASQHFKQKINEKYKFLFQYRIGFPGSWELRWRVSEVERRLVELLGPGNRTIANIVEIIAQETKIPKDKIFKFCKEFYKEAKKADLILLKTGGVPNFTKTSTMPLFALGVKQQLINQ